MTAGDLRYHDFRDGACFGLELQRGRTVYAQIPNINGDAPARAGLEQALTQEFRLACPLGAQACAGAVSLDMGQIRSSTWLCRGELCPLDTPVATDKHDTTDQYQAAPTI